MNKFYTGIVVFVFCLSFLTIGAMAQKEEFSGKWKLDAAKSVGLPPGMNQEMTVTQTGDAIKIETKLITDQGDQIVPDAYTLNGKETDFEPVFPGGAKGSGKRTATRTENGFEVVEKSSVDTPEGAITLEIKRNWQLASDGKSLVIEMTVKGPQGEQRSKRTFKKI